MSASHGHTRGHSHGHGHDHVGSRSATRSVGRLWIALGLTVAFVVVEAVAAFMTGSLALLSDAGHMLTDGAAIALALGAIVVASRASADGARTFGLFRLEILASLANALLLFAVAGYVFVEAIMRLVDDSSNVDAGPMLVVAIGGLAVNIVVFALLREGARGSLAVKTAYVEALADIAGSMGVIVAAVVVGTTGWDPIDPIVAIAISIWIVPRAWHLAASALRVLLQVAPAYVDLDAVMADLSGVDGVVDVHDLHVWTLTSEMDVASAHMMITPTTDPHAVLDQARVLLARRGIEHATIQVEPDDHEGCAELNW
jgi:cobalt-zinc-cadmium efflux system protein